MRAAFEIVAGLFLVAAIVGLVLVVWGLARGGFDEVPAAGILLLIVAGIPVATRLSDARQGLRRLWGWAVPGASGRA